MKEKSSGSNSYGDEKRYTINNSETDDDSNDVDGTDNSDSKQVDSVPRNIGTLDDGTTAFMQWLDSVN